jgi:hypothetical protein
MRVTVWDPGMSTGVVEALVEDDQPIKVLDAWQIHDGVDGVILALGDYYIGAPPSKFVVEKFRVTPRVYRAAEVEALRIEGALMQFTPLIDFQYNGAMLLAGANNGGTTAAQKASKNKIAADNVLRGMGLWHTGKMIMDKDANDVNSAMKHLVAYARGIGHAPTIAALRELTDG